MPASAASPRHPLAECPKAGTLQPTSSPLHPSSPVPPASATPPPFRSPYRRSTQGWPEKRKLSSVGLGKTPGITGDGWPRNWAQWVGTPDPQQRCIPGGLRSQRPESSSPRRQGAAPSLAALLSSGRRVHSTTRRTSPSNFTLRAAHTPDMGRDNTHTDTHNLGAGPLPKRRELASWTNGK